MAIDYDTIKNVAIPDTVHSYEARDSILYALGVGLGADPVDAAQLCFTFEKDLNVLPTMLTVLGFPGSWLSDPKLGVDYSRVVHAEQSVILHRPLAPNGTVIGRTRVDEVIDRGVGRGAFVYSSRDVFDEKTGQLLGSLRQTTACMADGGFGGPTESTKAISVIPDRPPDVSIAWPILPQAALIYRLSGDFNPLHADPVRASKGGFDRPILHGLCTFGIAGHVMLRAVASFDPGRFESMSARLSAPIFPGETLITEIWESEEGVAAFRCKALERDVIVLNHGLFTFRTPDSTGTASWSA